jgi:steroid delta-isomerase-like uncharacterized protein
MSRSETEGLVRRFLGAVNASDSQAALACLAEDVAHDRPDGRREIGHDAFRQFFAERLRHGDQTLADIAVMSDESGNRAAAEFTSRGRSAASGMPGERYSVAAGLFFEIDDDLITRVSDYAGSKRSG